MLEQPSLVESPEPSTIDKNTSSRFRSDQKGSTAGSLLKTSLEAGLAHVLRPLTAPQLA